MLAQLGKQGVGHFMRREGEDEGTEHFVCWREARRHLPGLQCSKLLVAYSELKKQPRMMRPPVVYLADSRADDQLTMDLRQVDAEPHGMTISRVSPLRFRRMEHRAQQVGDEASARFGPREGVGRLGRCVAIDVRKSCH